MTQTKTYTPKTIENWRNGANSGGVAIRNGSQLSLWAQAAELSGQANPAQLAKAIDTAYNATENYQAARRLHKEAENAVFAATNRRREDDATAAMKAARSGDFAKVLAAIAGPDIVAGPSAEVRKSDRIVKACGIVVKAADRDLGEEGKSNASRDYLAGIWETQVVGTYSGDSLREAAAHNATATALRGLITQLAIATDPDADDRQIVSHLRTALRESNSPTMPTGAALRASWSQLTKEKDDAIAKAAEAKRADNVVAAAEAAKSRLEHGGIR